MNRFRRSKKEGGNNNNSNNNNNTNNTNNTTSNYTGNHNASETSPLDESLQAMDALVDSDPESTEIFDDAVDPDSAFAVPASPVAGLANVFGGGAVRSGGRSFHEVAELHDSDIDIEEDDSDRDDDDDDDSLHTEDDSLSHEDDDDDDDKKSDQSSGEDYSDDEDEGEEGYRPGGYHRVSIGEVYNQR